MRDLYGHRRRRPHVHARHKPFLGNTNLPFQLDRVLDWLRTLAVSLSSPGFCSAYTAFHCVLSCLPESGGAAVISSSRLLSRSAQGGQRVKAKVCSTRLAIGCSLPFGDQSRYALLVPTQYTHECGTDMLPIAQLVMTMRARRSSISTRVILTFFRNGNGSVKFSLLTSARPRPQPPSPVEGRWSGRTRSPSERVRKVLSVRDAPAIVLTISTILPIWLVS